MNLPRTLCDSDKEKGRVQIINGDIFYSPNCRKELKSIPERDVHNILRPCPSYENIRKPTNFSATSLTDYQSPRWWSIPFGWVAFVPRIPDFTGPILGRMNRLPHRHELHYEEDTGYSMPSQILQDWLYLERDIVRAVELLIVHTKWTPLLPAFPTVFGYRHPHKSWRTALKAFDRSRNWFVMWIAVLSYLIAVAETETSARKNYPLIALTDWYSYLVQTGCSETWLEGFTMSSMVCDFNFWVERAGTIVSLEDLRVDNKLPKVEWLCAFGIPNWYQWKLEWSNDTRFKAYAPLPHQIQSVFSGIPAPISQSTDVLQNLLPASPTNDSCQTKRTTWAEFQADRYAINTQRERMESLQHRNERLARERHRGTMTATVFEWIPNDDGNLIRTKVSIERNQTTLEGYEKGYTHYDAFWNEWDCYTEPSEGGGFDDENEYGNNADCDNFAFESDTPFSHPEGISEVDPVSAERRTEWAHKERPIVLSADRESSPLEDGLEQENEDERMRDDIFVQGLETEIFRVLRLHFGFTGTLPPAASPPVDNSKDWSRFMRVMGIKFVDIERAEPLFKRTNILAACDFIRRLQSNAAILEDEWDLGKSHWATVYLTHRMSCIRLLKVKPSNECTLTWYMFDFGSARTQPWMFTVLSATTALTVCRLDSSYTDKDLATYFLQFGMAFRTMQCSTFLTRAPYSTKSTAKRASRMQGYQFLIDDFVNFESRATNFLTENRRARIACMMGGVMWRVACSVVNWKIVLRGPSGWSSDYREYIIGVQEDNSMEFIDDALTGDEISDLCGMYYVLTGKGYQYENPSWYPTPQSFASSGFDYGYWSDFCEAQFKNWHSKGSKPDPTARPELPARQPINKGASENGELSGRPDPGPCSEYAGLHEGILNDGISCLL
ncbi:hypothetical protein GALMADRAFT_1360533 [Galerina marginata CBS 339.88]|uniref:Uncharacterized protein n=1 Tax=Galerina marginata (strain CBS 339.88) TaxID=685588 RepID=A0A067T9E0_GALM3|nr:hypothetical protein GALMADRAFT_1360533 [Galerina marginata CBS 339.88]